jgi:hypothetical protein
MEAYVAIRSGCDSTGHRYHDGGRENKPEDISTRIIRGPDNMNVTNRDPIAQSSADPRASSLNAISISWRSVFNFPIHHISSSISE